MTVLQIGPDSVDVASGPGGPVDRRLAQAALQWIDDPVGLYRDRPVAVADLWRAVMSAAAAGGDSLVVVHPDDWTDRRVGRLLAAANAVADDVRALPRRQWCADDGIEPDVTVESCSRRARLALLPLAVSSAALALLVGAALVIRPPSPQTVTEGRIAVQVPAGWTVARVTGGPGSRRLQVSSPDDPELALHITQSYAPESTPARVAVDFNRTIAEQPAGVFVDLQADARVAGRPAVTYREVRPGRVIDWSVVVAGSTLIGIGCQSPPQRTDAVHAACERAVASAGEAGQS